MGDGGETVLFGTDLNGTQPQDWGTLERRCQPTISCPTAPGEPPPSPFSRSVVVQPKLGRALFWYNVDIDSRGRGKRFVWSSIHGGCPTRDTEKWAANVWLGSGPAI